METMQHRKPKTNTKKVIKYLVGIVLLILIVGGGSFGAMYLMEHGFGGKKSKTEDQSSEQTDNTDSKKSDNTDSKKSDDTKKSDEKSSKEEEKNDKKPAEYEGQDANSYADLSGYIINASIADQKISIRAAINQATSGDCTFKVTAPSGKVSTGTSKLEPGPTSGFCIIENLELGKIETGIYKVDIILKSADKTGKISGEVKV